MHRRDRRCILSSCRHPYMFVTRVCWGMPTRLYLSVTAAMPPASCLLYYSARCAMLLGHIQTRPPGSTVSIRPALLTRRRRELCDCDFTYDRPFARSSEFAVSEI